MLVIIKHTNFNGHVFVDNDILIVIPFYILNIIDACKYNL
jgi:hypothetical protein